MCPFSPNYSSTLQNSLWLFVWPEFTRQNYIQNILPMQQINYTICFSNQKLMTYYDVAQKQVLLTKALGFSEYGFFETLL